MNVKKIKMKKNKEKINVNKVKQEPNWLLRITLAVIIIPLLVIAVMLLTSIDKSGTPVVGNRFDNQLEPEIKDSQLDEIKETLTYSNVDNVEVNLKSATLRILIDANDGVDRAQIERLANDAYSKVTNILPISKYFTNKKENDKTIKMYDLEIHVYNLIPEEGNQGQIYVKKYKNAPSETEGMDWLSECMNQEVCEQIK